MKTIICANSFEWLPANRDQGSIITSLPDASEIDENVEFSLREACTNVR